MLYKWNGCSDLNLTSEMNILPDLCSFILYLKQPSKLVILSQMIDEFTDVNEGEKEVMKMWNLHVMQHK